MICRTLDNKNAKMSLYRRCIANTTAVQ